jgi:hypothetical protein
MLVRYLLGFSSEEVRAMLVDIGVKSIELGQGKAEFVSNLNAVIHILD